MSGGSSLSLAHTAMPFSELVALEGHLSGAGSTLRLDEITLSDQPVSGSLVGTRTVGDDGTIATEPPDWGLTGTGSFTVTSGPCTVTRGGRCVGRAGGYLPNEDCTIIVAAGGHLGPCGVFDMQSSIFPGVCGASYTEGTCSPCDPRFDFVILPDRSVRRDSDCPAGVTLAVGDSVGWHLSQNMQGSIGVGRGPTAATPRARAGCRGAISVSAAAGRSASTGLREAAAAVGPLPAVATVTADEEGHNIDARKNGSVASGSALVAQDLEYM